MRLIPKRSNLWGYTRATCQPSTRTHLLVVAHPQEACRYMAVFSLDWLLPHGSITTVSDWLKPKIRNGQSLTLTWVLSRLGWKWNKGAEKRIYSHYKGLNLEAPEDKSLTFHLLPLVSKSRNRLSSPCTRSCPRATKRLLKRARVKDSLVTWHGHVVPKESWGPVDEESIPGRVEIQTQTSVS